MARFLVLAHGLVVGTTDLELYDAGVGVAHGLFRPAESYLAVRQAVVTAAETRATGTPASGPSLEVHSASGEVIATTSVWIDDFDGAVDPEITVIFEETQQFARLIDCRA